MLYQLSYASLLEIPNLGPRSPESSRRTGQSSKDITTELGVQYAPTHFRISAFGRGNNPESASDSTGNYAGKRGRKVDRCRQTKRVNNFRLRFYPKTRRFATLAQTNLFSGEINVVPWLGRLTMKRRRLLIPLIVLAIVVLVAAAIFLRKAAPPEAVRLLPGAQAYVYINAGPLRRADIKIPPVQLDPDYETFVKQTGFQFERDIDEAAFAVHTPPPNTPGENRYSEVFHAKFDSDKVRSYLHTLANRVDSYKDREIFNVPIEDRTVRVTLLGPDLVAISNVDDPLVIRGIVDRYKKLALPFGGPKLIRQYYRKLPFGTLAWAIADVARGEQGNKSFVLPGGFDLFFPPDTVALVSVRYLGSIDFKAEAITNSNQAAERITEQVSAFLALFRTLETNASGSDPDVKTFFDSLRVEREGSTAEINAELPKGFLKKILTEPPPVPAVAEQPPAEKSKAKAKSKRKH